MQGECHRGRAAECQRQQQRLHRQFGLLLQPEDAKGKCHDTGNHGWH